MEKVITPVNVEGRASLGIRAGDTVRVIQNIVELKKGRGTDKKVKTLKNVRKQTFEGLVISTKHGTEPGAMFTVRAVISGVGVEKTFPLYAPTIDSIEIVKRSKVRRSKLYFIRNIATKAVRRQLRNARMLHMKSDETVPPTEEELAAAAAEEEAKKAAEAEAAVAEEAKEEGAAPVAEEAPAEEPVAEEKNEEKVAETEETVV